VLGQARELFQAGPIIDRTNGEAVSNRPHDEVAATIERSVEHVMLDRFGHGQCTTELEAEIRERKLSASFTVVRAWQDSVFRPFTLDVNDQISSLVVSQAAAWIIEQLSADPTLRRLSQWRHELREDLDRLRMQPTPASTRRRRRRTTQG
jgi:hypothetical protein